MSGTTWALVSSTLRAALALSTAASTEERTGWCCQYSVTGDGVMVPAVEGRVSYVILLQSTSRKI